MTGGYAAGGPRVAPGLILSDDGDYLNLFSEHTEHTHVPGLGWVLGMHP